MVVWYICGRAVRQGLGAEAAAGGRKAASAAADALLAALQAAIPPAVHSAALVALATGSAADGVPAAPGREDSGVPGGAERSEFPTPQVLLPGTFTYMPIADGEIVHESKSDCFAGEGHTP